MMSTQPSQSVAPTLVGNLTPQASAEKTLWKRLRHHQLGVLFRRRQVMGTQRMDFYCPEAALVVVIEMDEDYAAEHSGQEDERFRRFGLETVRFSEQAVLENTDRVVIEIFRVVTQRTSQKRPLQS